MARQTERIASDVDRVESRALGGGDGHGLAMAGDGGRMVAVANQLRVRAVRLAAKARRHGNGNPTTSLSVVIDIAFYLVYALLIVRLVLGIVGGSNNGFVLTVVVALAALMILHGFVNRVRLARRYHKPDMLRTLAR